MSELEVLRDEIAPYIKKCLNENDCDIEVTGKTEKGENYGGDILFLTVRKSDGTKENLVAKVGKKNKVMREQFNIKEIYLRELRVYNEIFPAFQQFQHSRKVKGPFEATAKCYGTFVLEETELLLLENLKNRGFEMHDRQESFNKQHLETVLKNYAKFHAISFAMKDQEKDKFDALTQNYDFILEKTFLNPQMERWFQQRIEITIKSIKEEDPELGERVQKYFEPGGFNMLTKVIKEDFKDKIIVHSDCWNSNFMFKYEDENKETPVDMVILDWQLSGLHSPAFDLSYFLHIVSDGEQLAKIDELLHYYHEQLSNFLKELGSDPEKLFPYSTLKDHWNRCAHYGLVVAAQALEMMMCDRDEAPEFDDIQDLETDLEKFGNKIKAKDKKVYRERIVGVMRAHLEWKKNQS